MPHDPFRDLPFGRLSDLAQNPFAADPHGEPVVDETIKEPEGAAQVAALAGYALVQPHRGQLAYRLGMLGMLAAILGAILFVWQMAAPIAAFPFTLLAWWIGRHELQGMRRGLVDPSGAILARRGYWLGLVGTVLVSAEMMVALAYFAWWFCVQIGWF